MDETVTLARDGIVNLVRNCAQVTAGQTVMLVNDSATVEHQAAKLLAEAVAAAGAKCETIWIAPDRATPAETAAALTPLARADTVIASTRDIAPFRQAMTQDRPGLLVGNLFHTVADFATEHARGHWGLVHAIYARMDALMAPGRAWRITSPGGTELSGRIGGRSARASYREDDEPPRCRWFHAGAYRPIATVEGQGRLSCDYTGGPSRIPCDGPPVLVFEDNRLVGFEGPAVASKAIEGFESSLAKLDSRFGAAARILDSFHGGCHPWAEYKTSLVGNGCTRNMHFHIGRTTGKSGDYIAAEIGPYTLTLDGTTIYRNGTLAILDDPLVMSAARDFGLPLPTAA